MTNDLSNRCNKCGRIIPKEFISPENLPIPFLASSVCHCGEPKMTECSNCGSNYIRKVTYKVCSNCAHIVEQPSYEDVSP